MKKGLSNIHVLISTTQLLSRAELLLALALPLLVSRGKEKKTSKMEVEPNGASLNFPFSSSSFSLTAFPGLSKAEADDRGRGCGGYQEAGPHNIVFAG